MASERETARAVAAAVAVAREHGVACDDARVLAAGSNVMVHLAPAPVVARVMTGTAELHDDVARWLRGEVAVGRFLGRRGLAVAPADDVLPPGPHERDGLWMTFWALVTIDGSRSLPGAGELGSALREMHAALAAFPDADGLLDPVDGVRAWLDRLAAAAGRDDLRAELEALAPAVFASPLPVQAIHGDASMGNLLRTDRGLRWNDLEDACVGPVHWDLAGLVHEARTRDGLGEAYVTELLAAYDGPALDELGAFVAAHALYGRIWSAHVRRSGAGA